MDSLLIIVMGCILISAFDALGAVLSRVLNFKYVWLMVGSIILYGLIGLKVARVDGLIVGIIASFVAGVFDATVGFVISKKLKANIPEKENLNMKITPQLVISIGMFAGIVGLIAILIFN